MNNAPHTSVLYTIALYYLSLYSSAIDVLMFNVSRYIQTNINYMHVGLWAHVV